MGSWNMYYINWLAGFLPPTVRPIHSSRDMFWCALAANKIRATGTWPRKTAHLDVSKRDAGELQQGFTKIALGHKKNRNPGENNTRVVPT